MATRSGENAAERGEKRHHALSLGEVHWPRRKICGGVAVEERDKHVSRRSEKSQGWKSPTKKHWDTACLGHTNSQISNVSSSQTPAVTHFNWLMAILSFKKAWSCLKWGRKSTSGPRTPGHRAAMSSPSTRGCCRNTSRAALRPAMRGNHPTTPPHHPITTPPQHHTTTQPKHDGRVWGEVTGREGYGRSTKSLASSLCLKTMVVRSILLRQQMIVLLVSSSM